MPNKQQDTEYTPNFVQEMEDKALADRKEELARQKEEVLKRKAAEQQEEAEAPEQDEAVDIGEPEVPEEKTPQQKSQAVTKALVKDKAINFFLESASGIINVMSRIDNEEGRRLIFFALNRTEIAMQDHYPKPITWQQINQRKLVSALANVALLGLDAEQGEVYPILYKDGKVTIQGAEYDRYMVNMQRGYKGERKIRLKYAMRPLLDMDARLIREGDKFFVHTTAQSDSFEFDSDPFSDGKVKGAFAWVIREDGTQRVKVLTMADIEKRKQASMDKMNGKLSPAWKNWPNEMTLAKTILAASRDIPLEIKDPVIQAAFRDTDYENVEEIEIEGETEKKIPLPQGGKFRIGQGQEG